MAQQVKNLTNIYEAVGSIPGLVQWLKGSGIAMRCGVGHRCSSDLTLSLRTNLCHRRCPKKKRKKKRVFFSVPHWSITIILAGSNHSAEGLVMQNILGHLCPHL